MTLFNLSQWFFSLLEHIRSYPNVCGARGNPPDFFSVSLTLAKSSSHSSLSCLNAYCLNNNQHLFLDIQDKWWSSNISMIVTTSSSQVKPKMEAHLNPRDNTNFTLFPLCWFNPTSNYWLIFHTYLKIIKYLVIKYIIEYRNLSTCKTLEIQTQIFEPKLLLTLSYHWIYIT